MRAQPACGGTYITSVSLAVGGQSPERAPVLFDK
jgi:hypothetical protein